MKVLLLGGAGLLTLLGSALGLLAGHGPYPADPEGTLKHVRHGTLRVGYAVGAPWVEPGPGGPQGIEPALVRSLAHSLDARLAWIPGTEQHLFEALEKHELDLLIAGLTDDSPWKEVVALTRPYAQTTLYVGAAPGTAAQELRGQPVAVAAGTATGHYVRARRPPAILCPATGRCGPSGRLRVATGRLGLPPPAR
jgi:polar amino acid transport system substrate-binding protein